VKKITVESTWGQGADSRGQRPRKKATGTQKATNIRKTGSCEIKRRKAPQLNPQIREEKKRKRKGGARRKLGFE